MDEKEKIKEMLKKNKKKVSVATLVGTVVVAIVVGVAIGYALLSLFFKGPTIPPGPQNVSVPPPPPPAGPVKHKKKPKPPKEIKVKAPVSSVAVSVPKPAMTSKIKPKKTLPEVVNTYASGVASSSGKKVVFKPAVKPSQEKNTKSKVSKIERLVREKVSKIVSKRKKKVKRVVVAKKRVVSGGEHKCVRKRIQEAMRISPTAKRKYVVQVASDRNKKMAIYTLGRLIRCGYKSYLKDVVVHGKKYTRVMVGPVSSYAKAKFVAAQVKKALHLDYSPLIIRER